MKTMDDRANAILEERARKLAQTTDQAESTEDQIEVAIFTLGDERYALESRYVREVIPLARFIRVPGTPDLVTGITNFRGETLAIFELRTLLHVDRRPISDQSRVLVLGEEWVEFGIVADQVHEVTAIDRHSVQDPEVGPPRQEFCRGVMEDALILLDGRALLDDERFVIEQRYWL